ncbi:hypothetical protein EU527_04505 [Candidatus Thorarchaeota archaeon]|nr:MAG: hypothetical protein EU527_04505 [Candidatus Thorarchaeota archaeon]
MARTPVDVYRGLVQIQLDETIPAQIDSVVARFIDYVFAGEKLSIHLTRFLTLVTQLIPLLDSRKGAEQSDLTMAVDFLDYVTSTSKWWTLTRDEPGFVLRPPSREARAFIKSIADLHVGGTTLQRISNTTDKLSRFLEEHEIKSPKEVETLCNGMISAWALLSAFACKGQGRNVTTEEDFETAYDFVRILLFYANFNDFRALTVVRQIGSHPILSRAAGVTFSPGFDKMLNISVAANLEKIHGANLVNMTKATSGASRTILTNSLRLLGQIQAVGLGIDRLEEEHYDTVIVGALETIEKIGVSSDFLQDETAAITIFKSLRPSKGVDERIQLLIRRLESLIVDTTGNKDFLLQYARLVPRLVALLLLLAIKTKETPNAPIEDADIKRGLILLYQIINS